MIRKELKNYFDQLENTITAIDEITIQENISNILNSRNVKLSEKQELAELIAFSFVPNYPNKGHCWGTYYGPIFVMPNKDGHVSEFPSIQQVDEEVLAYWRERASFSKHPLLSYRYLDLVIDFEPVITKNKLDYKLIQNIIDHTIQICNGKLNDGVGCKTKLKRSFLLAIKINDASRLEILKKTIIATEKSFAVDDKPGLWGYSFEWLLINYADKISLTDEEKNNLVSDAEKRLERLISTVDPDPWLVESVASSLAEYYFIIKNELSLKTALEKIEKAFRLNKYANSDGLLITNYLQKISEIYSKYSQFQFAKQALDRITSEIGNLGERGKFAIKNISVEIPITNDEKNEFIKSLFGDNGINPPETIINKFVVYFIPKKDVIENQLNDFSKKHPLMYLVEKVITSDEGYPIAKVGSITENYNQHLLLQFSENLHFQSIFLRMAFEELRKRYTSEALCETIMLSPVFRNEDKNYIFRILNSFWNKDYIVSCCLIIPLIEDAIRNLYKMNGLSYIKKCEDSGGYDVLSLHKLLDQGLVKTIYGKYGENVEYYFKVLLTVKIGWNLRNNFAHGINKAAFSHEDVSNRLLHILFCLSLIRKNDKP